MNKNPSDLSSELEDEVLFAKAISEIIKILHTASYGYPKSELTFGDVHEALWLIHKIAKYHSDKLLDISENVFSALNEMEKNAYSSSNAPV